MSRTWVILVGFLAAVSLTSCMKAAIGIDTTSAEEGGGSDTPVIEGGTQLRAVSLEVIPQTQAGVRWLPPEGGVDSYTMRTCQGANCSCDTATDLATQPAADATELSPPCLQRNLEWKICLRYTRSGQTAPWAEAVVDTTFRSAHYSPTATNRWANYQEGALVDLRDVTGDGIPDILEGNDSSTAHAVFFQGGTGLISAEGNLIPTLTAELGDNRQTSLALTTAACGSTGEIVLPYDEIRLFDVATALTAGLTYRSDDYYGRLGGDDIWNTAVYAAYDPFGDGCTALAIGETEYTTDLGERFGAVMVVPSNRLQGVTSGNLTYEEYGRFLGGADCGADANCEFGGHHLFNVGNVDGVDGDEILFTAGGFGPEHYMRLLGAMGDLTTMVVADNDYDQVFAGPLGDVNGDGIGDFFIRGWADAAGGVIKLFYGVSENLEARAPFQTITLEGVAGAGKGVAASDYDNDGTLELLISTTDDIRVYRQQGSGQFAAVSSFGSECVGMKIADVTGDSCSDVVCGTPSYTATVDGFDIPVGGATVYY